MRRDRRLRRRQLLLVDGEHLVLLSREAQGLRARPERRRRQPRRRGRPAAGPARDHRRRPGGGREAAQARRQHGLRGPRVDAVHRHRRARARTSTWTACARRRPTRRPTSRRSSTRRRGSCRFSTSGRSARSSATRSRCRSSSRTRSRSSSRSTRSSRRTSPGLGFVGALIGSIARPLGGWLSDRIGGARVTLAVFVGMGVFTARRDPGRAAAQLHRVLRVVHGDLPARRHRQRVDLQDDPVDLRGLRPQGRRGEGPRAEGRGGRVEAPRGGGHRHRRRDRRVRRLPHPGRPAAGQPRRVGARQGRRDARREGVRRGGARRLVDPGAVGVPRRVRRVRRRDVVLLPADELRDRPGPEPRAGSRSDSGVRGGPPPPGGGRPSNICPSSGRSLGILASSGMRGSGPATGGRAAALRVLAFALVAARVAARDRGGRVRGGPDRGAQRAARGQRHPRADRRGPGLVGGLPPAHGLHRGQRRRR